MTTSTEMQAIQDALGQGQDFFEARACLMRITDVLEEDLPRFDKIKISGSFDLVPETTVNIVLAWESILKQARAALLANSAIVENYLWRPSK